MITEYSVFVSFATEHDIDSEHAELDGLMDALRAHSAAVSGGGRRYDAQLTVSADHAQGAAFAAPAIVAGAARSAGLPPGRIVALEVLEWEELERRLERPNHPELVSAPEIATMLGVSRQRVHQLLAENRSFPQPLYRLGAGPLWLADAIRAFERRWPRRPGRPTTVHSPAGSGKTTAVVEDVTVGTNKTQSVTISGARRSRPSPGKRPTRAT